MLLLNEVNFPLHSSEDRHWCTPMIVVIVNEAKVHTKSGHLSENKNTTQVSKLIEANNLDIYTTSISIKAPTVTGHLNGLEPHSPNLQSCICLQIL